MCDVIAPHGVALLLRVLGNDRHVPQKMGRQHLGLCEIGFIMDLMLLQLAH
jgi:hypothetical protein